MRQIAHVDMDAFFASVEQRDNPELRGKPVLVGGTSRRAVVAAASYEARVFGARSAMPMYTALRLCPEAIVVPVRHDRYAEVSAEVFSVFRRFTPLVEGLSLDEAFLDVTQSATLFGRGEALGRKIKDAVFEQTGLRASAGIAPCKFVAKIASDLHKPDGLVVVTPEQVDSFLAVLPIERMWGIGPKTAPKMRAAGITTLGELARADRSTLEPLLGNRADEMSHLARGIDPRPVEPNRDARSYGSEETYERDLVCRGDIEHQLLAQSARVAERLTRDGLAGRTVAIKLKLHDFRLITRRCTLPDLVADTDGIYTAARHLLAQLPPLPPVRLTGISVSGLDARSAAVPNLFDRVHAQRAARLEQVSAQIRDRFGQQAVTRASLLPSQTRRGEGNDPPSPPRERRRAR